MNRKILSVLCIFTLMLAITMPSQAATGYQGYAVYRDGVYDIAERVEWHAAIMVQPDKNGTLPVAHSRKPNDGTELGTWSRFLDGYTLKGYFIPNSNLFNAKKDSVVSTARSLASAEIEYTFLGQIDYEVNNNPDNHGYVWTSDITKLRCDGLVEYCYEFNNMRVYGDNTYWNISVWGSQYKASHNQLGLITPRIQALQYLVQVQ